MLEGKIELYPAILLHGSVLPRYTMNNVTKLYDQNMHAHLYVKTVIPNDIRVTYLLIYHLWTIIPLINISLTSLKTILNVQNKRAILVGGSPCMLTTFNMSCTLYYFMACFIAS